MNATEAHGPRSAAVNPARTLAVRILAGRSREVEAALTKALTRTSLLAEDRRLTSEIVLGTTRMQRRLDHHLHFLIGERAKRLPPRLNAILRTAAYQILFLDRVPDYAVVDEAVSLARVLGHRGWTGLVNAVLRRLSSAPEAPPFPDPSEDPIAAWGTVYSYPDWIVRRISQDVGVSETEAFLDAGNRPGITTLRANSLRIDRESLLTRLGEEGGTGRPCDVSPRGVRLDGRHFIAGLGVLREGLVSVQDESGLIVADLLTDVVGGSVADLCAAPGGKTLAIAEAAPDGTRIIAVDRIRRLARLRENLIRLGWCETGEQMWRWPEGRTTIEIQAGDARAIAPVTCDTVIVDAPCSGLGVLARHAELRWSKSENDVTRLASVQTEILDAAARWVAPGGRLLYSTCSVLTEENEDVANGFLSRHSEFAPVTLPSRLIERGLAGSETHFLRTWPHRHGMDGSFACLMRRAV